MTLKKVALFSEQAATQVMGQPIRTEVWRESLRRDASSQGRHRPPRLQMGMFYCKGTQYGHGQLQACGVDVCAVDYDRYVNVQYRVLLYAGFPRDAGCFGVSHECWLRCGVRLVFGIYGRHLQRLEG